MNCRKLERNSPREIRRFIEQHINTGEVWHFLFVGKEGRKKSSVPRAICDELGAEVMELSCTNQTTPEKNTKHHRRCSIQNPVVWYAKSSNYQ